MKYLTTILLIFLLNSYVSAESLEGKVEYKSAMENYQQQKFLMSIGGFRKAIDLDYKTPEVYFYLGNALSASQSFTKAILQYKIALELNAGPDLESVILYNMGNAYYQLKEYTNSIRYFEDAYSKSPERVESFWLKGMAWYQMRNKEQTIQSWENYLSVAPEGPQSDNIRKALAILKSEGFQFPDQKSPADQTTKNNGVNLVNIEGVLDKVELEDKGKAEDTELEDIEM